MVLRLLLFFLFIPFSYSASEGCLSALKTLFSEEVTQEEASNFLKIQGDITLHRMAWAYLKAQKSDQDTKLKSVEKTILTLLDEKYTSTDPKFIKAREAFESQPLSRTTLAEIAPYLKELLLTEFGDESDAFQLNASDLKLLGALAKFEKQTAVNGKYDSRFLSRKSPQAMLNLMKIINSSYRLSSITTEDSLQVELQLQGVEKTIENLREKLNDFLKQMKLPSQCQSDLSCEMPDPTIADVFEQNTDIQEILWDTLSEKLVTDDILLNNLSYGEIWLKTKGIKDTSPAPSPSTKKSKTSEEVTSSPRKTVQTKIGNKIKSSVESPVKGYFASEGTYIEDPISIIVKDRQGRKASSWKTFDRSFQEKMADAILNDEKIFEINGRLYNRKTGKSLSPEQALSFQPPKKVADFKKNLKGPPEFQIKQIEAFVNGRNSFVQGNKLYDLTGKELSPEEVIGQIMTQKAGFKHAPSRYKGMEKNYLVLRANALKNNKPRFKVKNEVFDTETGRNITSPFRSTASIQDVKIVKERRKNYQHLSDKETIVNYHRDQANKSGCQHYAIVDKSQAEIIVYNISGKKVYSTEVLVGRNSSDQRTRWTVYGDREKQTNSSTGAGVYTISQPRTDDPYYSKLYNKNILQLLDHRGQEQVLAVHQVPNGYGNRYTKFGTGNPEDRRVSSGCVNLKESDYLKLTEWMKPTCKIYILPEEEGNRFVLKNNQINFTSEKSIPAGQTGLYNFNPSKKSLGINIRIVNPEGMTKHSSEFVKTLESEKSKLMKIFNMDNDDYNDLAMLSYAIMGNESEFGKSTKFLIKETNQEKVILAKAAERLFEGENPFDKSVVNTSRGFTQIKDLPEGEWRKHYPEISKGTLINPRHSAIATMAYLADAVIMLKRIATKNKLDPQKVKITRENMLDYLGYIYQGRGGALTSTKDPATPDMNTYVQNLRKHMTYIEVSQKIE